MNSNGLVTVKCVFMQGSINERCYLIFLDAAQGLRQHFIVNGFKETNLTLTESGNYSVEVYDIVNGIIYGLAIELPKLIEVTIISPSASSKVTPTNIIPTSSSNPSDSKSCLTLLGVTLSLIYSTFRCNHYYSFNYLCCHTDATTMSIFLLQNKDTRSRR